jgi:hypothetical protein
MITSLRALTNIHRPSGDPDVFIFAAARSGSTLLQDLILTQPGFKPCTSTFDLRVSSVARHLAKVGINEWADLYTDEATEAIAAYIRGISAGRIHLHNPVFFRNHFRLITRRVAFKILDACEDRIPWFQDTFNCRIVYLIRHPIPVSISRRQLPRLEVFVTSPYRRHFTRDQLDFAGKIIASGSGMQRAVLDWCFQNSVPLRNMTDSWTIVSYEQLVLDPRPVVETLCARLGLPHPSRMLGRSYRPSSSTEQSERATRQALKQRAHQRNEREGDGLNQWLVERWRQKIDSDEERQLMEILDVFQLDTYRHGSSLPANRFWIRPLSSPPAPR